jgi:hypothetical protein
MSLHITFVMFVVDNHKNFQAGLSVYSLNTRNKNQLYMPTANLSCFQRCVYYSGVKIFNNLPNNIKNLMNDRVKFNFFSGTTAQHGSGPPHC